MRRICNDGVDRQGIACWFCDAIRETNAPHGWTVERQLLDALLVDPGRRAGVLEVFALRVRQRDANWYRSWGTISQLLCDQPEQLFAVAHEVGVAIPESGIPEHHCPSTLESLGECARFGHKLRRRRRVRNDV